METFRVTIQSPLVIDEHDAGLLDDQATEAQFKTIDWTKWALVYADPSYGDCLEAFYYFEAKRPGEKRKEPLLCISGQAQTVDEVQKHGPLCRVQYFFLEKSISKGFLGFGAGKESMALSDRTMRDCTVDVAQKFLEAFLQGDLVYLDQHLKDNDFEDSY